MKATLLKFEKASNFTKTVQLYNQTNIHITMTLNSRVEPPSFDHSQWASDELNPTSHVKEEKKHVIRIEIDKKQTVSLELKLAQRKQLLMKMLLAELATR